MLIKPKKKTDNSRIDLVDCAVMCVDRAMRHPLLDFVDDGEREAFGDLSGVGAAGGGGIV